MNTEKQDLSGQIALITGASRGIGAAIALELASRGAHIIALARTIGGLEELDDKIKALGGAATLLPMDLNRLDKIDTIGPGIAQRFGRLDMFIGNAAMLGPLSPVGHVTPKDWEKVMAVNFMANVRLVRTLDPLLRASPAGLAAFVITGLLMKPGAYWGPYIASKAALNAFAQVYAQEVKQTHLRVKTFDPGIVQTSMLDEAFPGGFQGQTTSAQEAAQKFMRDML